jgi:transposase
LSYELEEVIAVVPLSSAESASKATQTALALASAPLGLQEEFMVTYCGLDVHKKVVEACVLDAAGLVIFRMRFTLTPAALVQFCKDRLTSESKVALEATTNTWAVVKLVRPLVAEVVVSNPMQTKAIAQAKVKTDKVDALILAQLLRCDFLPQVWQPDEATQELRRLTCRRSRWRAS